MKANIVITVDITEMKDVDTLKKLLADLDSVFEFEDGNRYVPTIGNISNSSQIHKTSYERGAECDPRATWAKGKLKGAMIGMLQALDSYGAEYYSEQVKRRIKSQIDKEIERHLNIQSTGGDYRSEFSDSAASLDS